MATNVYALSVGGYNRLLCHTPALTRTTLAATSKWNLRPIPFTDFFYHPLVSSISAKQAWQEKPARPSLFLPEFSSGVQRNCSFNVNQDTHNDKNNQYKITR